jgi:hypothetical protein
LPLFTNVVEEEFCELHVYGVLGSSKPPTYLVVS